MRSLFPIMRGLRPMGRVARCMALGIGASLIVASTNICASPQVASTAEILAIQSLVAEIVAPSTSTHSVSPSGSRTVLDVQRLLNGVSSSDEEPPSTSAPTWWALAPAPVRSLSLDAAPLARLLDVPRTDNEGYQQQVQPFLPPPMRRVLERYRMMLMPHAPPLIRYVANNSLD